MRKETVFITMSDGYKIAVHRWVPEGKITALVQVSHGMAEYAERYDHLGQFLTSQGIVMYAHDHRGHGESAVSDDKLGYLCAHDGFQRVTLDLCEVIALLKSDFPDKKTFLFSHSFGSFVSQNFIEQFAEKDECKIDGCILSGSAGPRLALARTAKILAHCIIMCKGDMYRSKFLDKMAFGAYNKKIKNPKSRNAWLSRDENEVAKYDAHPHCGFLVTAGFFKDLFTGLSIIHTKKRMCRIPHTLPVFLFAGTGDPVGDYGKTIKRLAEIYTEIGITDVTLTLYPEGRHEMLNEINKDEVINNIYTWIKEHLKG